MTEQEKINSETQKKLAVQDAKFAVFMNELQQQREDIRRLNEKYEREMHEMNQRFYDKVDENQKEFAKQLHANFIQTMLGVGAIMAAIGGLIIAALK